MRKTYSLRDAKARLSALVKMVREGRTIVITVHGVPAVEMRPLDAEPTGMEQRLARLEEQGIILPRAVTRGSFKPVTRRPGALKRFLAGRD